MSCLVVEREWSEVVSFVGLTFHIHYLLYWQYQTKTAFEDGNFLEAISTFFPILSGSKIQESSLIDPALVPTEGKLN